MALRQINQPFPVFTDLDGSPLDAGYVYFGAENDNPETSPITVYYDAALTQPASQPLRTANGYIMRNGSPALIFANSDYSLTVRNKAKALVITAATSAATAAGALLAANNLSDVANAATSLQNLGLTATAAELNFTDGVTSNIQTQLDAKAPLASPALTGTPTAPTAAAGTNTTQIATTAFVQQELPDLNDSGGAPLFVVRAYGVFTPTSGVVVGGNIASVTDNGAGDFTFIYSEEMTGSPPTVVATAFSTSSLFANVFSEGTTSCRVRVYNTSGVLTDPTRVSIMVIG